MASRSSDSALAPDQEGGQSLTRSAVADSNTDNGRAVCPDLDAEPVVIPEILSAFKAHPDAWRKFRSFPPLYQRVRIDNIQRVVSKPELFESRLTKLIEASEEGEMIGDWHDCGRLLDY